eukprot:tig00021432_g21228.t1
MLHGVVPFRFGRPAGTQDVPRLPPEMSNGDLAFAHRLDSQFHELLQETEERYTRLPKHLRIRVEQWAQKLAEPCEVVAWKKSRNAYAKLLLEAVIRGVLEEPFNSLPPTSQLPQAPSHLLVRTRLSAAGKGVKDGASNARGQDTSVRSSKESPKDTFAPEQSTSGGSPPRDRQRQHLLNSPPREARDGTWFPTEAPRSPLGGSRAMAALRASAERREQEARGLAQELEAALAERSALDRKLAAAVEEAERWRRDCERARAELEDARREDEAGYRAWERQAGEAHGLEVERYQRLLEDVTRRAHREAEQLRGHYETKLVALEAELADARRALRGPSPPPVPSPPARRPSLPRASLQAVREESLAASAPSSPLRSSAPPLTFSAPSPDTALAFRARQMAEEAARAIQELSSRLEGSPASPPAPAQPSRRPNNRYREALRGSGDAIRTSASSFDVPPPAASAPASPLRARAPPAPLAAPPASYTPASSIDGDEIDRLIRRARALSTRSQAPVALPAPSPAAISAAITATVLGEAPQGGRPAAALNQSSRAPSFASRSRGAWTPIGAATPFDSPSRSHLSPG